LLRAELVVGERHLTRRQLELARGHEARQQTGRVVKKRTLLYGKNARSPVLDDVDELRAPPMPPAPELDEAQLHPSHAKTPGLSVRHA
jgi:hypothetical protein